MTRAVVVAALALTVLVVLATTFGAVAVGPVRILALERAVEGGDTTVALRPGPGLIGLALLFLVGSALTRFRP